MKNKINVLTKIFLKNSFSNMGFNSKDEQTKTKKIRNAILYLCLAVYLIGVFGFMSYNQISILLMINQAKAFIGLLFLGIGALVIIQGVVSSINVLYFSKDIEHLLPLPIKPRELVMAKLNTVLITEYIVELMIALIPLIMYGILTGASIIYYLVMLLVLLVFPIIPILIASLIIMIIMSFAKISRDRDKFQLVVTFLIVIAVVAFQMTVMNVNEETTDEQMAGQLVQMSSISDTVGKYLITLPMAINTLTDNNIANVAINLLEMLAITAIVYFITIFIGEKIYLKGAVGNNTRGKASKKQIDAGSYSKNNIAKSYVIKELKILIRNPIFFMQCVLPAIFMPVLIGIIGFSRIIKNRRRFFTNNRPNARIKFNYYFSRNRCSTIFIYDGIHISNSSIKRWIKCNIYEIYTNIII